MSWEPEYIILIIISTIIDYIAGIQIYKSINILRKKIFLWASIAVNLGLLFSFKYFNFFSDSFSLVLQNFSIPFNPITLNILLPIGISFYTFQTMSYTIDIYRGKIKPERHLGIFATFVSFFPQLVAGPIERAKNLLPQFFEKKYFEYKRVIDGLKLILWGFFKKLVIADRLAIIVDVVYNNPTEYQGISLILATIFFAFQIYCDFSGYSDIAIGTAKIMGFDLMKNFKRPYFSKSIKEFWKRWHISLSSWFKDYLYIPLGGNKVSIPRWYINLLIVFIVSGLWHGANWTFIFWGALHGFYLLSGIILKPLKGGLFKKIGFLKFSKARIFLEILTTFILVNFGWIFFRSNSISDAVYIIKNIFRGINFKFNGINPGIGMIEILVAIIFIFILEIINLFKEIKGDKFLDEKPIILRWAVYIIILLLITIFGVFNNTQFIYFQF